MDMEDEERTAIPFLQLGTRIGETAHLLVQRLAARALDEVATGLHELPSESHAAAAHGED